MKVQTLSVICGTAACNAKCPFCVAKMTPNQGVDYKEQEINWRNFDIANRFARDNKVSTVLLTGKGEPTLYPEQITGYMEKLSKYDYSFIELQTNGIAIAEDYEKFKPFLKKWHELGMTTIALSVVHYNAEKNREVYSPHNEEYIDLPDLVEKLHSDGYSVRLNCMMAKGYIDDVEGLEKLVDFAKENKIEQLTVRSINKPEKSENEEVYNWVLEHELSKEKISEIKSYLDKNGSDLLHLPHGAVVYDLHGQNICLNNCLTMDTDPEKIRQLIFFPDGHLRYDWQYKGATLL